jgi:hypothetical protein
MPTYTFEKVSIKRKRSYRDSEGKKRQKTKEFYQTLNPFNKTKDGKLKTESQIRVEIEAEAKKWMELPDAEIARSPW